MLQNWSKSLGISQNWSGSLEMSQNWKRLSSSNAEVQVRDAVRVSRTLKNSSTELSRFNFWQKVFIIIEKSLSLPIRPDIQAKIVPKLSLQAQGWAAEGVFVRQGHQKYAKTKLPQFENVRVRQVLAPNVYLETSESFKILRTLLF